MKIKKRIFATVLSIMLIGNATATAYAAVVTLFRHSAGTYVTTEHGDSYWADTYNGVASVRGSDLIYVPNSGTYSFAWTRITYDVQGSIQNATAYSNGSSDSTIRRATITVKDKWNAGSKTRALFNYGLSWHSNTHPYSLKAEE